MSQTGLGHCLGLSKMMVSQVERGVRGLPLGASLPQAALTLAQHQTDLEPIPEALDVGELRRHQQRCQLRADQLAFELAGLPERAAWARRRLAAMPTLTAVLVPGGAPLPSWLAYFESEAKAELQRSGSTAQALMRLRQAALASEAAQVGQLMAAAAQ
ncbi:hypothetical protein [Hymenobacter negativus]|uniref:XRE family transcriptional regulator n=1 Tax=Hymenobacter negativus TaxID=2795026 RepID=A0ABS3QPZ4_9BACT|nr:hypothetical protein [Hymenobacter negativus]MBO2012834.1 hypothetical protein [Hymenobacter negativus]